MIEKIALVASVLLPMWNIPLILRMVARRSSEDISLSWALGVWVCAAAMFPQALLSKDFVWKLYSIVNFVMFSGVTATVLAYRLKRK